MTCIKTKTHDIIKGNPSLQTYIVYQNKQCYLPWHYIISSVSINLEYQWKCLLDTRNNIVYL